MAAGELAATGWRMGGVPVLMYHGIGGEDRYSVAKRAFAEQLEWLRTNEVAVLSLAEFAGRKTRETSPAVVLTFDDGLASDYEAALPMLLEQRVKATFFVTSSLLGRKGYVSAEQLREMAAAGMNIGSHGHEHVDHSTMSAALSREQLTRSRMVLEDATGCAVNSFSAPFGFINRKVCDSARAAGFERICSSLPWTACNAKGQIARLAVYQQTRLDEFAALVAGRPAVLLPRMLRHAALYWPKWAMLRACPERLGVGMHEERA